MYPPLFEPRNSQLNNLEENQKISSLHQTSFEQTSRQKEAKVSSIKIYTSFHGKPWEYCLKHVNENVRFKLLENL